ncbi:MAG: hypothetical protein F4202_00555 [Cenarchaeum sp. SB0677_bin_16]|nr:hypothetical protein [Cenarchaeum sp. SB0677_bin_16]
MTTRTLRKAGDAIEGERVVCTYRKSTKATLIRLTNTHRGNEKVLRGNVRCVIISEVTLTAPHK